MIRTFGINNFYYLVSNLVSDGQTFSLLLPLVLKLNPIRPGPFFQHRDPGGRGVANPPVQKLQN
jgi:hypothetical protein